MRIFAVLVTLIIGSAVYAQTDSTERAILKKMLLNRDISKSEYSFIERKWNETIKMNSYPDLPIGSDGNIQYSYVMNFQDVSKIKLFNRILEWISITYGIVPAYLYSNAEDGKIICPNSVNIQANTSGTYALVFTIKDGVVLIDFSNIDYQVSSGGYYSGDNWIPEKTDIYSIDKAFPIIQKDISRWTSYLKILNTLDEHFHNSINSLNEYITNYDLRYIF